MPGLLTEITEVATALGASGAPDLDTALERPPSGLVNVAGSVIEALRQAHLDTAFQKDFAGAWENGRAFFESDDGLRGRVPLTIEWKGPHRAPGYDNLPVDLRIDHVYLVSCKYQSRILANSSPANLFHRRLVERTVESVGSSWYETVVPDQYSAFYSAVRNELGETQLPEEPRELTDAHKHVIRESCSRAWPEALREPWNELSFAIAKESARRWNLNIDTPARREEMLWRLLRLGPAPYFVLGASANEPMRLRIGTPWDWKQHFTLEDFTVEAIPGGQPIVAWSSLVSQRSDGRLRKVEGHVEVRWAHGRFSTVEAKVYLDTPHAFVPGYFALDPKDQVEPPPVIDDDEPYGQLALWSFLDGDDETDPGSQPY